MFVITISSVSAQDNITVDKNNTEEILSNPPIPEIPDIPDLIVNETIYITQRNINEYFKENNIGSTYEGKTFVFEGNFADVGKLTVNAKNITIKGDKAFLKNTVFDISADRVTLSNLQIDLDTDFEDNGGAVILFDSNDLILDNLDINYIVPFNTGAYVIFGVGKNSLSRNLKLVNSKINFEGHNNDVLAYNCAIKLVNYMDSLVENNTVTTSLPLKDVNHGAHGTALNSDFVYSVGVEYCDNLMFKNNIIISDVNYRSDSLYPTLDCFVISQCNNVCVLNNSIFMSDFITYPGIDNYMYGIDIYNLNNLTISYNYISIITTGGKLSAGTAYPIQITGPISKVNITYNDLYSFSNGPNIGIYSQNYYGSTEIWITNNKINVTGLAGAHEWALVAGIETQDTYAYIVNNTIEVHSVQPVNVDDNIYGISYRQSTDANHQYNIQNNTVFSDGFKSVYLLSSQDSIVSNNLLVSFNENAKKGYDGFAYNDLSSHKDINFMNNKVIRAFDYFAGLYNNVDNGEEFKYSQPTNVNNITNNFNANSISPIDNQNKYTYNPLVPGHAYYPSNNNQYYNNSTGNNSKKDNTELNMVNNVFKNNKGNSTSSENSLNIKSNNSDSTPSDVYGEALYGESSLHRSSDESSSVSKRAFEIEDSNKSTDFIPSIYLIILVLIFIVVGYKHKKLN